MANTLLITLKDDLPMQDAVALFDGVRGIVAISEATEERLEADLHMIRGRRQRAGAQQEESN